MPISSDFADLLEVAIVNNLSKIVLFNMVRYHLSLDELNHHYQALHRRDRKAHLTHCAKRCGILYRRCLASAMSQEEREHCGNLYQSCLKLCNHRKAERKK